jgi:hypothetical protein
MEAAKKKEKHQLPAKLKKTGEDKVTSEFRVDEMEEEEYDSKCGERIDHLFVEKIPLREKSKRLKNQMKTRKETPFLMLDDTYEFDFEEEDPADKLDLEGLGQQRTDETEECEKRRKLNEDILDEDESQRTSTALPPSISKRLEKKEQKKKELIHKMKEETFQSA